MSSESTSLSQHRIIGILVVSVAISILLLILNNWPSSMSISTFISRSNSKPTIISAFPQQKFRSHLTKQLNQDASTNPLPQIKQLFPNTEPLEPASSNIPKSPLQQLSPQTFTGRLEYALQHQKSPTNILTKKEYHSQEAATKNSAQPILGKQLLAAKKYSLQIGVFSDANRAKSLLQKLQEKSIPIQLSVEKNKSGKLYRLQFPGLHNLETAEDIAKQVRQLSHTRPIIVAHKK
jgi:cell division septation protein DedD